MFSDREGETVVSKIRPSRRARWRRYTPPLGLALLGTLAALLPPYVTGAIAILGVQLTYLGTTVLFGILAVLATGAISALVDEHPLVGLAVGTAGLLVGYNMAQPTWLLAPLILFALAWIGVLEIRRLLDGLTIRRDAVVLTRALRSPLQVPYETIQAVHASEQVGPHGAVILETEHGTVTQTALPRCEQIQARIEARMHAVPVEPTEASLRDARERVDRLLCSQGARS